MNLKFDINSLQSIGELKKALEHSRPLISSFGGRFFSYEIIQKDGNVITKQTSLKRIMFQIEKVCHAYLNKKFDGSFDVEDIQELTEKIKCLNQAGEEALKKSGIFKQILTFFRRISNIFFPKPPSAPSTES